MIAEALAAAAFACPGPPAVLKDRSAGALRTTLVTCQGQRRIVVRRARLRYRPRMGRRVTVASRAGERIAWGELRHRRGRVTGWVKVARIAGGRAVPVHRRVVLRRGPAQLDVVMTTRGELAWLARWRVLTATLRGQARLLTRDAWSSLALEDDRTLRWKTSRNAVIAFHDLDPWPGGGCPARSRFKVVGESAAVIASQAFYDVLYLGGVDLIRACDRATGDDPVILEAESEAGYNEGYDVLAVSGRWLVVRHYWYSRSGCEIVAVETWDGLTGAPGQEARLYPCSAALVPPADGPAVATERGIPAWIAPGGIFALTMSGVVELDRGAITELTADGDAVRWRNAGEPRSAVLE